MKKKNSQSILHEIVFLFMSVVFAGTIYVIPQTFLLKYYPDSKNTFLTLLVVAGTIAAIIGVWLSNNKRIFLSLGNRSYSIILLLIALTILLNLLYFTHSIIFFLIILITVKFISNFLYNYLDMRLSGSNTEQGLKQHVKAVLLYQLLAYVIAPLYFSFTFFKTPLNITGITLLSVISIVFIVKTKLTTQFMPYLVHQKNNGKENKLDRCDMSFLLYSILVQVGMMIISSLIIFILRDYYLYKDAVQKGGILVGFISFISVLAIISANFISKKYSEKSDSGQIVLSTKTNYIAMFLFFMSALLFLIKLSNAFIYLLATGTLTGIAYGLYLYSTRTYANMKASKEQKTKILVHYNNIANIGTLISLSLIFLFTRISIYFNTDFNKLILTVVMCLCILCMAAIVNYSIHKKIVLRRD